MECFSIPLYRYTDRILTEDKLNVVRTTLWKIRAQYKDLGRKLGLGIGDIEAIEYSNHHKADTCFTAVLTELLRKAYLKRSWP